MAARLHIDGGRRLGGRAVAPPDKSIAHRALILAALGRGRARVVCPTGLGLGEDNRATIAVLRGLGVAIAADDGGVVIDGVEGPRGFTAPAAPLDCANSGTTMRLMAGVLAASPHTVTLTGDASLCGRPMDRLAPLVAMGARIDGQGERVRPPITVHGGARLRGLTHTLAIASAQVKSAVLLAGLWAEGETVVIEPSRSRDHTERMLAALGTPIEVDAASGAIRVRALEKPWSCAAYAVPPDLSSAAFVLGAALLTGSADVVVETAVNPTRTGFLDALAALGASVVVRPAAAGSAASALALAEPIADVSITVPPGGLRGARIDGPLSLRAIDEIPLLAAIAAFIPGRTIIADARELRVKESDRLTAIARVIRAFGGVVEETPDGLIIDGDPARLHAPAAPVPASPDHRIFMSAAVIALAASGATTLAGADVAAVSFPSFAATFRDLGAAVAEIADTGGEK